MVGTSSRNPKLVEIESSVEGLSYIFWNEIIVFPLLKSWNRPYSHVWCITLWFVQWWFPSLMGHTNFPSITLCSMRFKGYVPGSSHGTWLKVACGIVWECNHESMIENMHAPIYSSLLVARNCPYKLFIVIENANCTQKLAKCEVKKQLNRQKGQGNCAWNENVPSGAWTRKHVASNAKLDFLVWIMCEPLHNPCFGPKFMRRMIDNLILRSKVAVG